MTHNEEYRLYKSTLGKLIKQTITTHKKQQQQILGGGESDFQNCHIIILTITYFHQQQQHYKPGKNKLIEMVLEEVQSLDN